MCAKKLTAEGGFRTSQTQPSVIKMVATSGCAYFICEFEYMQTGNRTSRPVVLPGKSALLSECKDVINVIFSKLRNNSLEGCHAIWCPRHFVRCTVAPASQVGAGAAQAWFRVGVQNAGIVSKL